MGSFVPSPFPKDKAAALAPFAKKPVFETLHPRLLVKIDGQPYTPLSYSFTSNAHGATDTATVEIPIEGNPDWTIVIQRDDSLGNADEPVTIEIYADANNTGQFVRRFVGVVGSYDVEEDDGITSFSCLSLAAPLTSTKITTPFGSPTGSGDGVTTVSFIEQQAARFGLTPKITLGPNQQPGTMRSVLASQFVTGVRNWVIWDLMLQCAKYDDVDVWVDREGVLHYEAADQIERALLQYSWGQNIKRLRCTHSPQFSKNVQVEVRSYVKKTRTSAITRVTSLKGGGISIKSSSRTVTRNPSFGTATVTETSISSNGSSSTTVSSSSGGASNSGLTSFQKESGKEKYVFYVANKTPQQCNDLAQKDWRQISMHEYSISMTVPVTLAALPIMDVSANLQLYGTRMALFSTKYWPRQITEACDPTSGWMWDIDALSHELAQGAV